VWVFGLAAFALLVQVLVTRQRAKPTSQKIDYGETKSDIKMEPREIGRSGMDWIDVSQGRDQWRALVNKVMNLRVP
jgi:hypothetical protein